MKNKNKMLLVILGVLLVMVVGVSFAYFLVNTRIFGDGASTSLGTSNGIKVQYDAGSGKLEASNFYPKDIISKEFKVIVTPTNNIESVTYRIYMNITENTFTICNDSNYNEITNDCKKDAEEVIYRLKDSEGNVITSGDLTNGVTGQVEIGVFTKTPTVKTEYGYILEIEYVETNSDQNHNKNAVINGEVKVEFAEPDTTKPIINNVTTSETKTEITVKVEASDDKAVTEYYYQIDSEEPVKKTESTHTFTGLTLGSSHTIKVYVKDAAGNQSDTVTKTAATMGSSDTTIANLGITGVKDQTSSVPNFNTVATSDEGIFRTEDGMYGGKSVYWRGAVTNNYVKFANKCWRIVRINGDGSIRLIYDGSTCHANGTSTAESIVTRTAYNTSYNNSSYVGWTYTVNSQRPTIGGTASNAKTQLESWFNSTITGTDLEKVADGKYCNDRNTKDNEAWRPTGSTQYYAAYQRLAENKTPTLSCDANDVYTLKVGLITADEVAYAGGRSVSTNSSYYLYNGQQYWTMSPCYWNSGGFAGAIFVDTGSYLNWTSVTGTFGLRPVINLKSNTMFVSGGDGTQNNPYVAQ